MRDLCFRYFPDGDEDIYSRYIMDCFHQKAYYIIKNLYRDILDPQFLFINDMSYYLPVIDSKYISRMYCPSTENPFYSIRCTNIRNRYKDVENAISSIISQNSFAIVQTFIERVPFMRYYNLDTPFTNHTPSHVFMIVAEDTDHYFVVEEEWVINGSPNYTYLNGSKDIGVIPKAMLIEAFSVYANLYAITVPHHPPSHEHVQQFVKQLVLRSINSYNDDSVRINGKEETFWGRKALLKLLELSESETIDLTDYVCTEREGSAISTGDLLCYMFSASFNVLIGYRKLFQYYLHATVQDSLLEKLIEMTINLLDEWKFMTNKVLVLHENNPKYKSPFTPNSCQVLAKLVAAEDNMFEELYNAYSARD